jgi:hypothetical protein
MRKLVTPAQAAAIRSARAPTLVEPAGVAPPTSVIPPGVPAGVPANGVAADAVAAEDAVAVGADPDWLVDPAVGSSSSSPPHAASSSAATTSVAANRARWCAPRHGLRRRTG